MREQTQPIRCNQSEAGLRVWLRSWRYFIWLLAFALVILLFYAEENWRGRHAWESYRGQRGALGERMNSREFVPPQVPMSENFAMTPFLAPLFEFIPGTQKWASSNGYAAVQGFAPGFNAASSSIRTPRSAGSNCWVKGRMDFAAWSAAFSSKSKGSSTETNLPGVVDLPEAAAAVLKALADSDSVLDEIRGASQRRYCRFNIKYDEDNPASILLPHLAALKHLCQVLQLRACAELTLGRTADAASDVRLMLYLVDAARQEPILISQLVRMALLQMALQPIAEGLGQWSVSQLMDFQDHLEHLDFVRDVKNALDAERVFFGGGVIDYVRRNSEMYDALAGVGKGSGVLWAAAPAGWFDFEKVNYARLFEVFSAQGLDASNRRIAPALVAQADRRVTEIAGKPWPVLFFQHRSFCAILMPGFSSALRKTAFAQSGADLCAIACSLERYRLEKGRLPETLDALLSGGLPAGASAATASPSYFASIPRDVIDGGPLRYRRLQDDGYLLYSVGWDEKDDGGKVVFAKGQGDIPAEGDWVWCPLDVGRSQ